MKYYLLDYENVNASGLDGIGELSSDCRIVLFYTKNSSKIDLGVFNMLRSMKAEMSIIEVHHGKQALDIQLASYLGYLIGTEPADTEYFIISKDKGYRNVQSFWRQCQVIVEFLIDKLLSSLTERCPQISPALVLVAVSCRFLSRCSPVRSPEPPGELSAAP